MKLCRGLVGPKIPSSCRELIECLPYKVFRQHRHITTFVGQRFEFTLDKLLLPHKIFCGICSLIERRLP